MRISAVLYLFLCTTIFSQSLQLNGFVYDAESGNPLPFVNIRIGDSNSGTTTNSEGKFLIKSGKPELRLIFSSVGYGKKELVFELSKMKPVKVGLMPVPVQLSEIIVSGEDEDPAYAIIREAIKRKIKNREGLNSLEYQFFTKNTLLSAGRISMVSESYSTGYIQKEKPEKVIVNSIHVTENERKNKLALLGVSILENHNVNFSAEKLMIAGSQIYLPLADNAFDYYRYKLIQSKLDGKYSDYFIEVIPRSSIQPLLQGIIVIEDSTYSLKSIELKNNGGIRIPFVNDFTLELIQKLDRFSGYWLPTYYKSKFSVSVNFSNLLTTEPISSTQVDLFTDYRINPVIPDSVYKIRNSLTKTESDTNRYLLKPIELTRTEIDSVRPIPLSMDEKNAYQELDSTKTFVSQIEFGGVFGGMAKEAAEKTKPDTSKSNSILKYFWKGLGYLYADNNRVNGISLGPKLGVQLGSNINLNGRVSYSFTREKIDYLFALNSSYSKSLINSISLQYYNKTSSWEFLTPYLDIMNAAGVFLGFEDQFNYYSAYGVNLGITKNLPFVNLSVNLIFERQVSIPESNYQSLFKRNRFVRVNPLIDEGNDNKISLKIIAGKNPQEFQPKPESGLIAKAEISNQLLRSSFNYKKIRVISQIITSTFYDELFIAPYLAIGFDGGITIGDYGIQHSIVPNSHLAFYSPFISLKGTKPYEYMGDKMASLFIEHNWRTILFQSLGLDFLTDQNLDIITGVSGMRIWDEKPQTISKTGNYWEVYAGIGKIMGVGRIDFSYNSNKNFNVTLALSTLL